MTETSPQRLEDEVVQTRSAESGLSGTRESVTRSGGWCAKCGCGNDAKGYAHLKTCPAPTPEDMRSALSRTMSQLVACHQEIRKLRDTIICNTPAGAS